MELHVGNSHTLKVNPRNYWTDTGINVESGQSYAFKARGIWVDWIWPSDADGYRGRLLSWAKDKKRLPDQNWFALIGSLNRNDNDCYLIGCDNKINFNGSGTITCFANDMKSGWFYRVNNWGKVKLTISRVS
jgi:hypothetical protein